MKVALIKGIIASTDPDVDDASNQFVFQSESATDWSLSGALLNHVVAFYNSPGTGATHPIASYISPVMSRVANTGTIEVYDITTHLDGSPHGSPVAMKNFTLSVPLTHPSGLPEGVAATVSFRSDYGTDVEFGTGTRPRARDRNRVYVGPLTTDAINVGDSGSQCTLSDVFIGVCLDAMLDLSTSVIDASNEWVLMQWSRKNAALKLPTTAWMDNRPDYQRRRSDPRPGFKTFKPLSST